MRLAALLTLSAAILGAWSGSCAPLPLANRMQRHETQSLGFWDKRYGPPSRSRVAEAPPQLIEYLNLQAQAYGLTGPVRPAGDWSALRPRVEKALSEVPEALYRLMGDRFYGVFVARHTGMGGFAFPIPDEEGRAAGGILVLDAESLDPKPPPSAGPRADPYFFGGRTQIREVLSGSAEAAQDAAIRWLVVHELAHLVSALQPGIVPFAARPEDPWRPEDFGFLSISWTRPDAKKAPVSRQESAIPFRTEIQRVWSGKAVLDERRFKECYDALERTDFPTLYAAANPNEDFAESVAAFVHVIQRGEPYSVSQSIDGVTVKTFRGCFVNRSCPGKIRYLAALLGWPGPGPAVIEPRQRTE